MSHGLQIYFAYVGLPWHIQNHKSLGIVNYIDLGGSDTHLNGFHRWIEHKKTVRV